jgi:hypothetical protein
MTEAASEPAGEPGQQDQTPNPDRATPEQDQAVASRVTTSSPEQQPPGSKERRSGEFWLALASTAVALVIGVTGFVVNFQLSARQIKAESDRAAADFGRQQRKDAYANFLTKLIELRDKEYKIGDSFEDSARTKDMGNLESLYEDWDNSSKNYFATQSAVKLAASRGVTEVVNRIEENQSAIRLSITVQLLDARRGILIAHPPPHLNGVQALYDFSLENDFIAAAQKDLGVLP